MLAVLRLYRKHLRDKHSSLFIRSVSDEEEVLKLTPGARTTRVNAADPKSERNVTKTFYDCTLQMFGKAKVICPWQAFLA